MSDPISWERHGRIAVMRLNRPRALNAFDDDMLALHAELLTRFSRTKELLVLVYVGEGRGFCAGIDIKSGADFLWESAEVRAERWVTPASMGLRKPTIAAIHGAAVGGGCELALGCDLRVMGSTAKLGLPEVRLGAIPGGGGTQLLPRLIGRGDALRILLTGESITAQEALRLRLVQQVVEDDKVFDAALELASQIARHGRVALETIMEAVDAGLDLPLNRALWLEQMYFERNRTRGRSDLEEGLRAFSEKRPPEFPSHESAHLE